MPKNKKGGAEEGEKDEPAVELSDDLIEAFLISYLRAYRERVEEEEMLAEFVPEFYKDYPYFINAYILPNKAIALFFKKIPDSLKEMTELTIDVSQESATIPKRRIRKQDFEYFEGILPSEDLSEESAIERGKMDAELHIHQAKNATLKTT